MQQKKNKTTTSLRTKKSIPDSGRAIVHTDLRPRLMEDIADQLVPNIVTVDLSSKENADSERPVEENQVQTATTQGLKGT